MKHVSLLIVLAALTTAGAARAGETGYIDVQRAVNECSDGKKVIAELKAEETAREKAKADVAAAKAAKKAPPSIPTDQQWDGKMRKRQEDETSKIFARMKRIFPKMAEARKLAVIVPQQAALYVSPKVDLTDELIRRYDAGEGATDAAAELAAARAKVMALERQLKSKPGGEGAAANLPPRPTRAPQ